MKLTEIKAMTNEELQLAERNVAEECWKLRFQHNTGQLNDSALLKKARVTRARILTVIHERELGISQAPGKEA